MNTITVNGKERKVKSPLSFEAAVVMGLWKDRDSVTYQGPRHGDSRRSGILGQGEDMELEDGMRFTAMFTGNA